MAHTTEKVEYITTVKAILREDVLTVSLAVTVPYGDRTATATVEEFPDELRGKLAAVLTEIKQAALPQGLKQARRAAAQMEQVAINRGEMD